MKRKLVRFCIKVVRAEGTPESIGRAAAIGLATGFILPIGFQTLPALFLAFVFKANKVLCWTFTCVSNPASVFFLYPVQCWIGSMVLFRPLTFHTLAGKFKDLAEAGTVREGIRACGALGTDIMIAFFAGGVLFALIFAPAGYWLCLRLAQAYRDRKQAKRQRLRQRAGVPPQSGDAGNVKE